MKKTLCSVVVAAALFVSVGASAQGTQPAVSPAQVVSGPLSALSEFVKGMQFGAGTAVFPDAQDPKTEGIVYWRGPQFGEKGLSALPDKHREGARAYLDLNIGGGFKAGEGARFLPMVLAHPGNLIEPLARRLPGSERWNMPFIPANITMGPAGRIPLPGDSEKWTWRNGFRWVFSWEF